MVQNLNFLRNFQKTLDILKVLWYYIRRNAVYTAVGPAASGENRYSQSLMQTNFEGGEQFAEH